MINSRCGYDPWYKQRRTGGCMAWVGYMTNHSPWGYPYIPMAPYFFKGIAWCNVCGRKKEEESQRSGGRE